MYGMKYLNRNYIDKENEPPILRLNVRDKSEKIASVVVSKDSTVLVIGKMKGLLFLSHFI